MEKKQNSVITILVAIWALVKSTSIVAYDLVMSRINKNTKEETLFDFLRCLVVLLGVCIVEYLLGGLFIIGTLISIAKYIILGLTLILGYKLLKG